MTHLDAQLELAPALNPVVITAEPLFEIQLLVARRADALARRHLPPTRDIDRLVWLRAELEILDGRMCGLVGH